jgi:hypothetical protein
LSEVFEICPLVNSGAIAEGEDEDRSSEAEEDEGVCDVIGLPSGEKYNDDEGADAGSATDPAKGLGSEFVGGRAGEGVLVPAAAQHPQDTPSAFSPQKPVLPGNHV